MSAGLRIALVTGGLLPVPAKGWGAVEGLVEIYRSQLVAVGHSVQVINSAWFNEAIVHLQDTAYDFIHLHHDLYCGAFARHLGKPFCLTSHYGGFGRYVRNEGDREYAILFRDSLASPGNLVFSEAIRSLYLRHGYGGFLGVLQNPVDVGSFAFGARGNGRAICLGRIQPRKRQAMLADVLRDAVPIDFAGPHDRAEEPAFRAGAQAQYLGEWNRETVRSRLTEYSAMVLVSRSEGDALVVKEALAAGLSVVVTEAALGTLEARPFVTVVPNEITGPELVATVQDAIEGNVHWRGAAREYARQSFDSSVVITRYLELVEAFLGRGR